MKLIDADKLKETINSSLNTGRETFSPEIIYEIIDEQSIDDMKEAQNDIASIIYNALDYMYCDNCRFSSEIKESDSDEWCCDECHRKYNGWGVSMRKSNRIAKEILKQLGE